MRYTMIAVALAAVPAAAQDQASTWQYFEPDGGPMQAGVVNAQGAQLILKCDKPGKKSVYAVVVTPEGLVPRNSNGAYQMRPAEFRFDENAPVEDRWRFYDHSAVAIDQGSSNSMTRFMGGGLPTASRVRVRFNPERGRWVEADFQIAGAQEAIDRVYASCQDEKPAS